MQVSLLRQSLIPLGLSPSISEARQNVSTPNIGMDGKKLRNSWTRWPIPHRLTPVARLEMTKELEAEFERIYKDPEISFEGDPRVGHALKDIEELILAIALRSGTVGLKKSTRRLYKPLNYQYILAGIARAGLLGVERFEELTARCDGLFGGNTQISITPRARVAGDEKTETKLRKTESGRVRKG